MRVWPGDVDIRHVNQSVYNFYLELSRWNFIYRSGLDKIMKDMSCMPVVAAQAVRILRPLRRFDKIRVQTVFSYWDDKWLYIQHNIFKGDKIVAKALIKGLFRGEEGVIPTHELFDQLGRKSEFKDSAQKVSQLWNQLENSFFEYEI